MEEITSHGFDNEVHGKLLHRDFDPKQVGEIRSAYDHALVESGRHSFDRNHFEELWGHMEKHSALKNLSETKRDAARSVFMGQLGIKDDIKEN